MMRPRLLDLFCGAGGAGMGYRRADFDVTGVDIKPQPRYPFSFIQGDALDYLREHGREYDVIHASPPCQAYSTVSGLALKGNRRRYPDLLPATQTALAGTGRPSVIENVEGAARLLRFAVRLCGSAFALDVRRHRYFESTHLLLVPPCQHTRQTRRFKSLDSRSKTGLASVVGVHGHMNYSGERAIRERAMDIDWMEPDELNEAVPPAYTEFIGRQLLLTLTP